MDRQTELLLYKYRGLHYTLVTVDVFKLKQVICRKSPILTFPLAFGASVGVTPFEFCRNLRHRKTRERLGYRVAWFS